MPDPLLYLQAMGVAAIVSAAFVVFTIRVRSRMNAAWWNPLCLFGIGLGLVCGDCVLSLRLAWPPVSGRDRLWLIVIPSVLCLEAAAGFPRIPRWTAWTLRLSLCATIPWILLYDSVYLSGNGREWSQSQAVLVMGTCSVLLATVWCVLDRLSVRPAGLSIPLVLCLTTQCAVLSIMMAGYVGGGAAAVPWIGGLLASTVALLPSRLCVSGPGVSMIPALTGTALVGLFGLLMIGRFFGELGTAPALTMLLAPLLSLATQLPGLRNRKPWVVGVLRLLIVALPLLIVLAVARRNFQRDMAPLLGSVGDLSSDSIFPGGDARRPHPVPVKHLFVVRASASTCFSPAGLSPYT